MRRSIISLHIRIWNALTRDEGQGLTEYALILVLIAVVVVATLTLVGGKVTTALSTVATSVGRAIP
jgi:pilus assembly protein Flp/PilA